MVPHLEFMRVNKTLSDGRVVLRGVDLAIGKGDFVLLNGPSGGGKSTLLRCAVRLEEQDGGDIRFNGRSVRDYSPPVLRSRIMLLPQSPIASPGTIRENLLFPFRFNVHGKAARPSDDRLRELLFSVHLGDLDLETIAAALSVGQLQRLALVRCLLLNPEILLLDEPVSALDPESKEVVECLAERLNQEGVTIIMVSHAGLTPKQLPIRRVELRNGDMRIYDRNDGAGL